MSDRQFESVINFVGRADQLFATVQEINSRINSIGSGLGTAGGGAATIPMPRIDPSWQRLVAGMSPDVRALNQSFLEQINTMEGVGNKTRMVGSDFGRLTGHIVASMIVFQAINTVMNAAGQTISTVTTETLRLDDAAARLSVTLGVSKESAKAYAQASAMMGVSYGIAPETSIPLASYAARVGRGAGAPNMTELFTTATKLGGITGEDPKRLMDDLNVTYRQSGIDVKKLGDMAISAWEQSGTAASEYLNIIREVGPVAKAAGMDSDRMFAIIAQAADRMGGSVSDAANTYTRLMKAIQDPNEMQKSVLLRYGIPFGPGANVQQSLNLIGGAGMSSVDLAALGGRPGQPAVANDIRTFISTMKTFDDKMQRSITLEDAWNQSTDSSQKALDRLKAAFDVAAQSLLNADWVRKGINELTTTVMNPNPQELNALAQSYRQETGKQPYTGTGRGPGNIPSEAFLEYITKQLPLMRAGQDKEANNEALRENTRALSMFQRQLAEGGGGIGEEARKRFIPSSVPQFGSMIDVSRNTQAEVRGAIGLSSTMFRQELSQREAVYKGAGFSQEAIDQMLKDFKDKVMSSTVILQSGGQMQTMQGPAAYYFQSAMQQISARESSQDRLASLRERLAELRASLDDLNDTEKKRERLEGQWNIPAGARLLAPIESGALRPEAGGSVAEANERQRAAILRQIEAVEKQIASEEALGHALDGLPPVVADATGGLKDTTNAQTGFTVAVKESTTALIGWSLALQGNPPRTPLSQNELDNKGAFGNALGLQNSPAQISVSVVPQPLNISLESKLFLDGTVVAQDVQRRQTQNLLNQARATGALSGSQ